MTVEKPVYYKDSNRLGTFTIPYEAMRDEREMLQALMALCTILEAGPHESGRGLEYVAASELFQPLAEGEEIPQYRLEVAWEGFPFKQAEERDPVALASGRFRFVAIRNFIVRVPPIQVSVEAKSLQ